MSPKDYYYKQFKIDFNNFWNMTPHRNNYVTGDPLFKFSGLIKTDNHDAFKNISTANILFFLSALSCTLLIDQVMYTYFKIDYPLFQSETLYPKMHTGWINANPFLVFNHNVLNPRNLHSSLAIPKFTEFANFFVSDLYDFFNKQKFNKANWTTLRQVTLSDNDIKTNRYGKIFIDILNSHM